MLAAVLATVLAVVTAQVVASLFWEITAAASVLGAAGIAHLAYVLHRDRPGRMTPAAWRPRVPCQQCGAQRRCRPR